MKLNTSAAKQEYEEQVIDQTEGHYTHLDAII